MMMVNRDLVVTYANPATAELMRKNAASFRQAYPSFEPSKLVGTCIEVFHRSPEHQRQLLRDPRKLPHRADIKVADLCFEINVSAMLEASGAYVGCALEWKDVTQARADAAENAANGQVNPHFLATQLPSHPRHERTALQGHQVCDRHHGSGAEAPAG